MKLTDEIDKTSLKEDVPEFSPGDTVKVHVRVVEGNRERTQIFEGAVICLLYTSPSPRDATLSRMPSSA